MEEIKPWMGSVNFEIPFKNMPIEQPSAKGKIALYMASSGEEQPKQMMLIEIEVLQNDLTFKKSIFNVEIPK